ncbi:MAG TPA: glucose-6-phosphate isomerase, partial [Acinetobacter radioresistens]|nr:glucose-6-phosphate isomerase [Acinetobacter radioresistens]
MNQNIQQTSEFPKNMPAYQKLEQLAEALKAQHLNDLFKNEPDRFNDYSIHIEQLTFDYSKHRVNQDVMEQLVALAEQQKLPEWIHALFSEQEINYTEQRAAMHWALRLPENEVKHADLAAQVHEQLQRMYGLVEKIHAGQFRGATGEVIRDVVNIGVGGSDLGPLMTSYALGDFKVQSRRSLGVHFVSTIDGSQLSDLLHQLRPETTLFIISSKSFSTIDTLSNAQTARQWLEKELGQHPHILKSHFIGVSTKPEKMTEWG